MVALDNACYLTSKDCGSHSRSPGFFQKVTGGIVLGCILAFGGPSTPNNLFVSMSISSAVRVQTGAKKISIRLEGCHRVLSRFSCPSIYTRRLEKLEQDNFPRSSVSAAILPSFPYLV